MSVASKNLFAALGSDDESDSRPVAQSTASKTEPKAAKQDNAAPRGGRGGDRGDRGRGGRGGARGARGRGGAARGGYSNEDALKESADVRANRERDVSESRPRGGSRGARATGGGRGREYDRHSASGRVDSQKAVDQGWGNEATSWESAAPIAEADREAEKKEAGEATTAPEVEETPAKEVEKEPEEEPVQTYADYLANQMKSGFSINETRKPDQGKWEATTSLLSKKARQVEEALFGEKTTEKIAKTTSSKKSAPKKVILDIEQRFTPAPRGGRGEGRGGRGGRGGESRGSGRGRGDGTSRGRGRGEDRGARGRGGAGGSTRGARGGGQTIDVADTNAFPALG